MYFKKTIIYFLLLLPCSFLHAQLKAKKITSVQFTCLHWGTIILNALFDDYSDTLNFILDTGSGGISLDSLTASKLQLVAKHTDKLIKGFGGSKPLSYLFNKKLKIGSLVVDSLDFHINDYSILSGSLGIKVDGITGYSFLKNFIVKLDYNKNIMSIYTKGLFKYPKRGVVLYPKINGLAYADIKLSDSVDTDGSIIFDTGAGLNLLLSNSFIHNSSFIKQSKKVYEAQGEGLAGKQTMRLVVVDKIAIGKYVFKKVPTFYFNDEINVINYPKNIGLLGNDILRRFNVIINYPNQEIHLLPNIHFTEDFDYTYTGMDLFQTENQIKVVEVTKNTPAYEAGIEVDDIIISVDNKFINNIQTFKGLLQHFNSSVKIILSRNGRLLQKEIHIKNILK